MTGTNHLDSCYLTLWQDVDKDQIMPINNFRFVDSVNGIGCPPVPYPMEKVYKAWLETEHTVAP